MVNSRFTYSRWPTKADSVDSYNTHCVAVNNGGVGLKPLLAFFLILGISFLYLFLPKGNSTMIMLCGLLLLGGRVLKSLSETVKEESLLVMPAFGIQLQTHYLSGKVIRRFVPVDEILKPILIECLTPITCYWSLSLLMREEAELTPVFKVLRPPVKTLVPIWEALCLATDSDEEKCLGESSHDSQL